MNLQTIAIILTTLYPKWYRGKLRSIKHTDKVRGDIALQTIHAAQKKGYQVLVADGKSSKTFRKELEKIENITLIKKRSSHKLKAKRQLIKAFVKKPEVKIIILTEPEKLSLITDCIPLIVNPLLNNHADIVIPKRNESLFQKTYTSYQHVSETEGNLLYNEILRANGLLKLDEDDLDIFFGPLAFINTPQVRSLFLHIKSNILFKNSTTHFKFTDEYDYFPVVRALKKGLRVRSVDVPFSYPSIQKMNEENGPKELFVEKRKNQRLSILIELLYFINFMQRKKIVKNRN